MPDVCLAGDRMKWSSVTIEKKVGPAGFVHNWIFVGVPGYGESVHHPRLGPGTVTHATDSQVHVQFQRDGSHRVIPVTSDPAHVKRLDSMSEQDIYHQMMGAGQGHHFDLAVNELDRRDKAENEAKATALYAEQPKTDADRDRVYSGLVDAGENPEDAYNHAHGLNGEDQRRKSALSQLREQGYSGTGFQDVARKAWKDDVQRRALHAEGETNGYLTNPEGRAKGVNGWDLFTGNESTARRYASPELKEYWDKNGRPTFDDFTHQLLHGHASRGRRQDDFLQ